MKNLSLMSNKVFEHVHQLIHSLSKAEKRYFKLYIIKYKTKEDNLSLQLFEAIEKQEVYDEEKLLQRFSQWEAENQFSIAKGRLYDNILKCLDTFYAESSINTQLHNLLHSAEILFRKTLYDQSAKMLARAKKIALKHEKVLALLEIGKWEKELIEKDYYSGKSEGDLDAILKQDLDYLQKLTHHFNVWNIKSRFFELLQKQGQARNEEEIKKFGELLDKRFLNPGEENLVTETRYLIHHTNSAYYFGIADYEASLKEIMLNIALIESHAAIFGEEPNILVAVITNGIYLAMQLSKYNVAFELLGKIKKIESALAGNNNNEHLEVRILSSISNIELTLYNTLGEFEKSIALTAEIEEKLNRYENKISKNRKANIYFNISTAFFALENYKQALKWVNKIINHEKIDESQDIFCFGQLLSLVIHIELEHEDLIPFAFKATSRYLTKKNRVYQFESVFLAFITAFLKTQTRQEQLPLYQRLHQDLQKLASHNLEKTAFEYFDFIAWAESKARQVPFKEIVKNRASAIEQL